MRPLEVYNSKKIIGAKIIGVTLLILIVMFLISSILCEQDTAFLGEYSWILDTIWAKIVAIIIIILITPLIAAIK